MCLVTLAKERLTLALNDPESNLKLVPATDALSMGSNPSKTYRVIFLTGPPNTMEMFVQMSGRGGRDIPDTEQFEVIIYYDGSDLNRKHMRPSMKEFCLTEECRRGVLLPYFGEKATPLAVDCCDNCVTLFDQMEVFVLDSVAKQFGWDIEEAALLAEQKKAQRKRQIRVNRICKRLMNYFDIEKGVAQDF